MGDTQILIVINRFESAKLWCTMVKIFLKIEKFLGYSSMSLLWSVFPCQSYFINGIWLCCKRVCNSNVVKIQ